MTFEVTRQNEYWPTGSDEMELLEKKYRYYVKSSVLANCMGQGNFPTCEEERIWGFRREKSDGYALLTYFVAQALNFRRLPFYEDRIYARYRDENDRKASEKLFNITQADVDEISKEFKEIYNHTQEKLKSAGLTKVKLRREIHDDGTDYTRKLLELIKCTELLNKETISFEMDMINSYGDEGAYTHNSVITIKHEIPASDILYCSNLVGVEGDYDFVETGEWVVLNRSLNGIVEIPIASIKYDNDYFTRKGWILTSNPEKFILDNFPLKYRNICYFEMGDEKRGTTVSLKRYISRWLMRNNNVLK